MVFILDLKDVCASNKGIQYFPIIYEALSMKIKNYLIGKIPKQMTKNYIRNYSFLLKSNNFSIKITLSSGNCCLQN